MDKKKLKIKLNDDQLDRVSGGVSGTNYGQASGIACTFGCTNADGTLYSGPHRYEEDYEHTGNEYTITGYRIYCGNCQQRLV